MKRHWEIWEDSFYSLGKWIEADKELQVRLIQTFSFEHKIKLPRRHRYKHEEEHFRDSPADPNYRYYWISCEKSLLVEGLLKGSSFLLKEEARTNGY
jgi:hypothetical protein